MRNLILTAALAAIFGLVGCGGGSPPGGPGAKDKVVKEKETKEKDNKVDSKTSFTFNVGSVSVEQGGTKEFSITVDPGADFKEDIEFSFVDAPKGVTFDPATPKVPSGGKEVKVTAKAEATAPEVSDAKVLVKAKVKGKDTEKETKVTVTKKK